MIEQLKKEEKELREALSENRRKQNEYYTEMLCLKIGIKLGYVIKFTEYITEYVGQVCGFECSGDTVYPVVALLNSNGKVGKRKKRIWGGDYATIQVLRFK